MLAKESKKDKSEILVLEQTQIKFLPMCPKDDQSSEKGNSELF